MIKKIKVPCDWEEKYQVGEFTFSDYEIADCYNDLLENPEVLEKIKIVDADGNKISLSTLTEHFPYFCYLEITENLPFTIYVESLFTYLNNHRNFSLRKEDNISLPREKGFYFNNYSNAYNGAFGSNGFEKLKSLEYLKEEKRVAEAKIEQLKKVYKFFEKPLDK